MKMQKTESSITLRRPLALLWLTASLVWFVATTSAVYAQEMNCELRESDSAWDRFWSSSHRFLYRNGKLVATGDIGEVRRDRYEPDNGVWEFVQDGTISKFGISIEFGNNENKYSKIDSFDFRVKGKNAYGFIIRKTSFQDSALQFYFRNNSKVRTSLELRYESAQPLMSIMDDLICITKGIYK